MSRAPPSPRIRPVFACLLPFGFTLRETAFASWVGLRGVVPIYLRIIPALADPRRDQRLFASIFILVIASLVVQGWTVGSATRLLGFQSRRRGDDQHPGQGAARAEHHR
jgi:NhaP-type Na+/H+ and K+/H+ antiporter